MCYTLCAIRRNIEHSDALFLCSIKVNISRASTCFYDEEVITRTVEETGSGEAGLVENYRVEEYAELDFLNFQREILQKIF